MRIASGLLAICGSLLAGTLAVAQGPPPDFRESPPESPEEFASRLLAYDKDKDGKLTKTELGDERLFRLFDRADADKDGSVTKDELKALGAEEEAKDRDRPNDFGPPPGGGPGGFMGPPRPGEILPPMFRQILQLSSEQRTQIEALQKDVDAKLKQILTDEQQKQLQQIAERGPGGFGPPGGRPPGGFGGGPQGSRARPPRPGGRGPRP